MTLRYINRLLTLTLMQWSQPTARQRRWWLSLKCRQSNTQTQTAYHCQWTKTRWRLSISVGEASPFTDCRSVSAKLRDRLHACVDLFHALSRLSRPRQRLINLITTDINPLISTLKPQSNGPSYSNTVIGTLAVDGWAVTFGTVRRGLDRAAAYPGPSSLYQM